MRGGCGGARGFLNSFNHATMLLIIPAYSHQTVSYLLTRTTQPDAAASLALTLCATSCTFSWVTPLACLKVNHQAVKAISRVVKN